jgi:PEP-CTERM motif
MLKGATEEFMFKAAIAVTYRVLLCVAFLSLSLQAGTVFVGEPPAHGTGSCDPFGCPSFFGLGTYQQVYSSSAFPGTISIDQLNFFDQQVHNGGQPGGGTYTLSFSYSPMMPGDLNLMSPQANISTFLGTFFVGTLPTPTFTGPTGGKQMAIVGTPFTYDPAFGNLLLTITVTNPSDQPHPFYVDMADSMTVTSTAYFGTIGGTPVSGGNDQGGLITEFTYTGGVPSVPEPASSLLFVGGAALLGYKWRRRKAA